MCRVDWARGATVTGDGVYRQESDGSSIRTSEKPDYLPAFGPDDCLWLVTVTGQWPVHVHVTERAAIHHMATLRESDRLYRDNVRVTKVTISTYEVLELQHEVVRESLVPWGEAVTS
ncbi:MAG: hypothetical protein ACOH10_15335 [Rhodoglobus sp.]